jgi:hypothetical protein
LLLLKPLKSREGLPLVLKPKFFFFQFIEPALFESDEQVKDDSGLLLVELLAYLLE